MHGRMLSLLLFSLFTVPVYSNLSGLCCGDNFCCAIIASTNKPTCWGGNSMSSMIPTTSTVKALTCGGKAVMGIDSDMKISFYVGSDGYGPDHASAAGLIGVTVKDADLSFWGGAVLKSDGVLVAWGPETVYCSSATSISCQPTATNPTSVNFAFTSVPAAASTNGFSGVNCGGKRGGHWCCAYETGVTGLACFGDARGTYTPTTAQLSNLNFNVYQISAGVDYIAVLGTSGQLGVYGGTGEIGNGLTNKNPSSIADLTMNSVVANEVYTQVSTMNFAIYAMKADGTLHAWGKSYSYSVGGGGSVDMAALVPSGVTFGQLYGGSSGVYAHYCALKSDGMASCWGADYSGQVSGLPSSAVSMAYSVPSLRTAVTGDTTSGTTATTGATTAATTGATTGTATAGDTTTGTVTPVPTPAPGSGTATPVPTAAPTTVAPTATTIAPGLASGSVASHLHQLCIVLVLGTICNLCLGF